MMADMSCTDCHERPGYPQPITPCSACHEGMGGLHEQELHAEVECWACHQPHVWAADDRETCLQCHDDRADHMVDGGACSNCHEFVA